MAKKAWIKGAIEHPGAFKAKAEAAGKTTAEYAKAKEDAPGRLGKQARLAETLMRMRKSHGERDAKRTSALYGKKG